MEETNPKNRFASHGERGHKARLVNHNNRRLADILNRNPPRMEGIWSILKCEMYYLYKYCDYERFVAAIEEFIRFSTSSVARRSLIAWHP
jgi:hypothetical protein